MAVQGATETEIAPQDYFDSFWSLSDEWVKKTDLPRHSSFRDTEWKKLVYFYQTAFGSAIKGL
ncbi:hypothetical protein BK662_10190 [Pseudomonas frederiksbergensis]|uniref:Uncharacterized protein n=1 Tax=Pseudomonas frederiksbergensis TaxID=104087 RepID=A0A423HUG9_9PSED|nr:hypothetical protein BK662_10190 [Pseudomonas frederiksbergensis]